MPFPERLHENEDLEGKVLLSREDARTASRLMRLLADAVGYTPEPKDSLGKPSDDELASRARFIIHSRRIGPGAGAIIVSAPLRYAGRHPISVR